jgi:hypothetical protein
VVVVVTVVVVVVVIMVMIRRPIVVVVMVMAVMIVIMSRRPLPDTTNPMSTTLGTTSEPQAVKVRPRDACGRLRALRLQVSEVELDERIGGSSGWVGLGGGDVLV